MIPTTKVEALLALAKAQDLVNIHGQTLVKLFGEIEGGIPDRLFPMAIEAYKRINYTWMYESCLVTQLCEVVLSQRTAHLDDPASNPKIEDTTGG